MHGEVGAAIRVVGHQGQVLELLRSEGREADEILHIDYVAFQELIKWETEIVVFYRGTDGPPFHIDEAMRRIAVVAHPNIDFTKGGLVFVQWNEGHFQLYRHTLGQDGRGVL